MQRRRWNSLSMEAARSIRAEYAKGVSIRSLGVQYGVTPEAIRLVVRGKTWAEPEAA
jgi:hypothetical protein